ncbi:MAG: cytochrome C [Xenococcaceae cyanobacterium MO_188.B29]|nr:cytochrome C [Xenococcaceae cyanobacterium MO_188.B29]
MAFLQKIFRNYVFTTTLVVVSISIIIGSQISQALSYSLAQVNTNNYQLGKELYLQNCSSCHIPIPAEVLPTATWQTILEKPGRHYGTSLPRLSNINVRLIWNYLRTSSRPLLERELKPEFVTQSRYFKALHPQVHLPQPVTHQSCILCHPGANKLDYVSLSSEFE